MRKKLILYGISIAITAAAALWGWSQFTTGLVDAKDFDGVQNAFIKISGLPVANATDENTRIAVQTSCGAVSSEQLSNQAAEALVGQVTGHLAGLVESKVAEVAAQLISDASSGHIEAPHLAQCLTALTIYRTQFPENWKMMDNETGFPSHPLAKVDELINASKGG